jgi:hypothetical protein
MQKAGPKYAECGGTGIFIYMIFSIQRTLTSSHKCILSLHSNSPSAAVDHGHIGRRLSPTAARTSSHPIEQATVGITTRWPLSMAQHLHP